MADRAQGRGSRDGIDCTILETRLGSTGTVLETELPKARSRRPDVGNAPSGASTIESWTARTQEGFSRRRTFGKAAGGRRADPKFCARCRTAAMRTVTRRKYQLTRNKVRLQNQLEALLEEAHIKLSSLVSDLLGVSARRMLKRSRTEEPIRPPWPLWPIRSCVPHRHSCATRSAPAQSCNQSTADCSRCS